jgi:hypothetical protein
MGVNGIICITWVNKVFPKRKFSLTLQHAGKTAVPQKPPI